jgi:dTDP-glucose pyrophosphorylase
VAATKKAVILARGLGKRMRAESQAPLTSEQEKFANAGVKGMIPFGRPFLDHCISALADAGCTQVCLVIGPEHREVREYYDRVEKHRVEVSFAVQQQPLGTADAVRGAESFVTDDTFLVANSDNLYPAAAMRELRASGAAGVIGFESSALVAGGLAEERVRSYAALEVNAEGELVRIVEKPKHMEHDALVSANCWSFTPAIFRACSAIRPSPRGELELPTAVQYAIENLGERFRVIRSREAVVDLSTRADIADVARRLRGREVRL